MSSVNLQVQLIAYNDKKTSNNPSIRVGDLSYRIIGIQSENPSTQTVKVLPGETADVFSGVRSTQISGSTSFDVTKPNSTLDVYRFSHNSGTAPAFRADRQISIDNTSVFGITVNGPIATLTNTGGTAIVTTNVQVGDVLLIESGAGPSSSNQGRFIVLSKTSTSVSFQNLNASSQSFTVADFTKLQIFSNGTPNQVQIGDKMVLSAGFSSASFGTFEVSEVAPSWVEVRISYPNGIPLETGIVPAASGMIFYSAAKKLVMVASQGKASVRINGSTSDSTVVEPLEPNNPEKPGLYIQQGTVYSLSIKNLSIETIEAIVASVE